MAQQDPARGDWLRHTLERYETPLLRYALRLTGGDADLARDLVQDTLVRLCQSGPRPETNHTAAWLFAVCRNRAIDVRRKESRMQPLAEVLPETNAARKDSPLEPSGSRAAAPDIAAETREATAGVLALLATLPPRQQEVVRLKFECGLSYKEIAKVMRLSATNVGFLIHTALKTIRERMQQRET